MVTVGPLRAPALLTPGAQPVQLGGPEAEPVRSMFPPAVTPSCAVSAAWMSRLGIARRRYRPRYRVAITFPAAPSWSPRTRSRYFPPFSRVSTWVYRPLGPTITEGNTLSPLTPYLL